MPAAELREWCVDVHIENEGWIMVEAESADAAMEKARELLEGLAPYMHVEQDDSCALFTVDGARLQ